VTFDPFSIAKHVLHRLPPETAHDVTLAALETGLVPARAPVNDPILATALFGHELAHPLGLAAGFDKNARVFAQMFGQGFSFVEVGGVTPRPQAGNPRPRVHRLPHDRGVVNRMGFPNHGADRVAARLRATRAPGLLGVNLAANADSADPADDFVALVRTFAPLADFLTLDVSCPNTANGQVFLCKEPLDDLLARIEAAFADGTAPRRPLAAKLSPDVDDAKLAELVGVLTAHRIDAIVLSNTTLERPDHLRDPAHVHRGGLSGAALFARSTQMLADVYALTRGSIPLVGVGGIATGAHAYAKIRAGATALQLYTAMAYEGPAVVTRILHELAAHLRVDGFSSLRDAIGAGHRARTGTPAG